MSAATAIRGLTVALLMQGSAIATVAESGTLTGLTQAERSDIQAAVTSVIQSILKVNVRQFIGHVGRDGLTCTDSEYSLKSIKSFLADKKSHLYLSLFDTRALAERCGTEYSPEFPALSDRDFLRSANKEIEISLLETDWVRVTITSPVETHYKREWILHRESGSWELAGGSFVVGRCSCG